MAEKRKEPNGRVTMERADCDFKKVTVYPPENKKANDQEYQELAVHYGDAGAPTFVQIKHRNVSGVYFAGFEKKEEEKSKSKGDDKKPNRKIIEYSASVYVDPNVKHKDFVEWHEDLENEVLLPNGMEKYKDKMGAKIAKMNFDPTDEKKTVTDKWGGFVKISKTGKQRIVFKGLAKNVKPDLRMVVGFDANNKPILKVVDIDDVAGKRCTCDIIARYPSIYIGNDLVPQAKLYSALILSIDDGSDIPDDTWATDAATFAASNPEQVKLLNDKMANMKMEHKPAAAGGDKDGSGSDDEGKKGDNTKETASKVKNMKRNRKNKTDE